MKIRFSSILLVFCAIAFAKNGSEVLNHYGLMTLNNKKVESDISARFKGTGQLYFLVHAPPRISIGDIIKFKDKVVLIDADVLQTLQTAGALSSLNSASVLNLQAVSSSEIWKNRKNGVKKQDEIKGYNLGEEIMSIFEENFKNTPTGGEFVVRFDGKYMTLLAPSSLVSKLSPASPQASSQTSQEKTKEPPLPPKPTGKPIIISAPLDTSYFVGDTINFQVWAADTTDPSISLLYGVSDLDSALSWSGEEHSVQGILQNEGEVSFFVWAKNSGDFADTMSISFLVKDTLLAPTIDSIPIDTIPSDTIPSDTIPVPRAPLKFMSKLSVYKVREGDKLFYSPVAISPNGDSIRYAGKIANTRKIPFYEGQTFELYTKSPGTYSVEFSATDGISAPIYQRISYEVERTQSDWNGFGFKHRSAGPARSWWLYGQLGGARLGLFTPRLMEIFNPSTEWNRELPYLFFGGSLTSAKSAAFGDYAWIDFGLQIRKVAESVYSGGIMLGIDGRRSSRNKSYPWVFEYELSFFANQAILAIDTGGIDKLSYVNVMNDILNDKCDLSNWNCDLENIQDADVYTVLESLIGDGYKKFMKDLSDRQNFTAFLRLEHWLPVWSPSDNSDFFIAPIYWREEYLLNHESHQVLGGGLRIFSGYKDFSMEQSIRSGYDSPSRGKANVRFWYDLTIKWGNER